MRRAQRFQAGGGELAESDEIFHLNPYSVAYKGIFREITVKFLAFRAIAAVDGAYGCERSQLHCVVVLLFQEAANLQKSQITACQVPKH